MYPLNVKLAAPAVGFAVANSEDEHRALSERGYLPQFAGPLGESNPPPPPADADASPAPSTVEEARAALDAKGIPYDGRWGLAKLLEALK